MFKEFGAPVFIFRPQGPELWPEAFFGDRPVINSYPKRTPRNFARGPTPTQSYLENAPMIFPGSIGVIGKARFFCNGIESNQ